LELDPKNISAFDKLAELYFYAAQYDKALLNLDEVIKLSGL
jgi:cytochrome c-type biogenesis protein CcmH/NrfG